MTAISNVKISFGCKCQPIRQNKANRQADGFVSFCGEPEIKSLSDKECINRFKTIILNKSSKTSLKEAEDFIENELTNADPEVQEKFFSFTYKKGLKGEIPYANKEGKKYDGLTMYTLALSEHQYNIANALFEYINSLSKKAEASDKFEKVQRVFVSASYPAIFKTYSRSSESKYKLAKEFLELTATVAPDVIADNDVHRAWKIRDKNFNEIVQQAFNNKKLSQQQAKRMLARYPDILAGYDKAYIEKNYENKPETELSIKQKAGNIASNGLFSRESTDYNVYDDFYSPFIYAIAGRSDEDPEEIINDLKETDLDTQKIFLSYKKYMDNNGFFEDPNQEQQTAFSYALLRGKDTAASKLLDYVETFNDNPEIQRAFLLASYYPTMRMDPNDASDSKMKVLQRFLNLTAKVAPGIFAYDSVHWHWNRNPDFCNLVVNIFNSKELDKKQAKSLLDNFPTVIMIRNGDLNHNLYKKMHATFITSGMPEKEARIKLEKYYDGYVAISPRLMKRIVKDYIDKNNDYPEAPKTKLDKTMEFVKKHNPFKRRKNGHTT